MHIRFNDTVGFTYQGMHLCMGCTKLMLAIGCVEQEYLNVPQVLEASVHELMSVWAARNSIPAYVQSESHTYDTELFDSDDLPKPFEDGDGEECHGCGLVIT